ncbi:TolC family protein [Cytophaga hutchinsonii]|uniref:Outer membrane efflux protein n=1 Tax=Cytophaga hutchinsonii (strain ATCC 33406 / DSM 1761 / CIP 103989 / NBRC 15051 / NCIMB 9469 / D465) TaxID=269798 RepID=A0A6N4STX6_CYTH3|nr:TolC family protein [Cytophaga hutchinsonii]ABG59899.1 outer membrane efflux protein [Cytophaga hutchinsonii ATCC 33406]SFX27785.1 Outer membrane protein TolC [Cytophaga hutchinsonii ATCC 33406]
MKNTVRYLFICLCAALQLSAAAQTDSSMQLSLKKAIEIGLNQRFDIKNQELAIQISESNRLKTQSKNLPQVNASIDFRYNAVLATSLLPPGAINNSTEYTPIKFGTPYNTLTSITATQNLFNAGVSGDKLVNDAQKEYDQVSLEKYKTDAKSAITQAYYQVLLNQEQIKLTTENVANAETIVKKGESEYSNGTLLKTDLSRYQLDLSNAKNQLQTATTNYENSLLLLKTQLILPIETPVQLTDNLEGLITNSDQLANNNVTIEQRYEYRIESSMMRLNDIQAKRYNRSYLPSAYLYGNASLQNQNSKVTLFNTDTWYPYVYVGIHADIPIFDGMEKSRNIAGYRLRSIQNKNNLEKLSYEIQTEAINTRNLLNTAYSQYQTSKENYALAQTIMKVDQDRYKEGTLTAAALKNTEYSLQNAQNNYLTSIYNVLIAQVNYKKAMGEL